MSSYFDTLGVLQELGVPSGEVSVDLCSGEGYFTAPLSRLADILD
jgi:predicted methyltransferase